MEKLTIVGTEGLSLVLATEHGQRFTLDIDDMLRSEVRRARAETEPGPRIVGPSPRDIQAHIRSGLSAEEVAELLQCDVERVRLFEGPVLAEREHIVNRALAMPVLTGVGVDQDERPTFGAAVQQKLTDVSASHERWTSWKSEDGWVIKLTFEASGIARDARWSFDPRRSALAPSNDDAMQLSRQGRLPDDALIPRLRALDVTDKDSSTFDENAFHEPEPPAPAPPEPVADTADLLEALRRRRGRREAPPTGDDEASPEQKPSTSRPLAVLGGVDPNLEETPPPEDEPTEPEASPADEPAAPSESPRRRGRPAMPSWDEIVFGARSDD